MKEREIEELVGEHDRIVEVIEREWRGEVKEARGQVEELRDVLAERETESKELRLNMSELEANTNNLHEKFKQALAHLEQESDEKDGEIAVNNEEIQKLGEQVYALEEGNDQIREEFERKLTSVKAQLQEMTDLCKQCSQDILAHCSGQEELTRHVKDLVSEVRRERETHERAEFDLTNADREHDAKLHKGHQALEAKESALQSALNDLREREGVIDKLHAENHDLASQLAAQTQVWLNVSEKLDGVQGQLRSAESEVATFKGRVNELAEKLGDMRKQLDLVEWAIGADGMYESHWA
ncbi:hypothetical protein PILCRDRAFT_9890 [Piloderma croceum F 1598]|uniref:Uncharacterized protein n=1 Tax=Piloderma croceum (strain F 1598) TaxID=765440 RepID=A0A0C3FKE8_PILCF|nr:hypothetical protein PILCRDRAFT_9890 [Piloderma croceum F 1598]